MLGVGLTFSQVVVRQKIAAALAVLNAGPDVRGSVSLPSAGVFRAVKNTGGSAFNCGFYTEFRPGDFRYQIVIPALYDIFIGVSLAPTSSSTYTDIPKAIYMHGDGKIETYNNGAVVALTTPPDALVGIGGETFYVDRTGTTITYKRGGTSYSDAAAVGSPFTGASGSQALKFSLFQVGATFDLQKLI